MTERVKRHLRILLAGLVIATGGFATSTVSANEPDDCCGTSIGGGDCVLDPSYIGCRKGCPGAEICCQAGGFCSS